MKSTVARVVRLAGVLVFSSASILFATSPAFAQCEIQTIGPNDSVAGTISSTDCVAPVDDAVIFFDIYEVTLASAGTLTVRMDSTAIDSLLILTDSTATDSPPQFR